MNRLLNQPPRVFVSARGPGDAASGDLQAIVHRLRERCLDLVRISRGTEPVLPGRIVLLLNPFDLAATPSTATRVAHDVASLLQREVSRRGWRFDGVLQLSVEADPTRPVGCPSVRASVD